MSEENSVQLSLEKAYEEVGTNYRYFLNWRRFLVTGWFTVMGAVSFAFSWVYKNASEYTWVLFFSTFVITGAFWVMDYRNRDLYHACQKSGEEIEQHLKNTKGIYTYLNKLEATKLTHSRALDVLFFTTMIGMLGGAIWSLCKIALQC